MKSIDQLEFRGAIGNQPLRSFTMNQFVNALKDNGWAELSYDARIHRAGKDNGPHFFSRLLERGPGCGIYSLNGLARALRDGRTEPAKHGRFARVCCAGSLVVIVQPPNQLVTII